MCIRDSLLLRSGRTGRSRSFMLVEPVAQIQLRAHEVRGSRSRAVPLVVEAHHCGRDLQQLECAVELLGLRHGRAQIVDARHQHRWRLDIADVGERRAANVFAGIFPRQLFEVVVPARAVGGADKRQPVDDLSLIHI